MNTEMTTQRETELLAANAALKTDTLDEAIDAMAKGEQR